MISGPVCPVLCSAFSQKIPVELHWAQRFVVGVTDFPRVIVKVGENFAFCLVELFWLVTVKEF